MYIYISVYIHFYMCVCVLVHLFRCTLHVAAPHRALHDRHFPRKVNGMLTGAKSAEMRQLLELGFGEDEAGGPIDLSGST